jgi:hypothetical protein
LVEVSDSAVRDLATKILERPEYAEAHQSTAPAWLTSALHWMFGWLRNLNGLHASAPGLYWLVMLALFGVFALLVAHIAWTISVAMRMRNPEQTAASGSDPRDPALEAEQLAASSRYLEAAHYLMIASFRTLAETSVIELRPDRPNRWIRLALRDSRLEPDLAIKIESLIDRTERHWFGDRENDPAIYSQWRSAYLELSRPAQ